MDDLNEKINHLVKVSVNIFGQLFLVFLIVFTAYSSLAEIELLIRRGGPALGDILLLLIYLQLFVMFGIMYVRREIAVIIPIFITIVAMVRIVVTQGDSAGLDSLFPVLGIAVMGGVIWALGTHKTISLDLFSPGRTGSQDNDLPSSEDSDEIAAEKTKTGAKKRKAPKVD